MEKVNVDGNYLNSMYLASDSFRFMIDLNSCYEDLIHLVHSKKRGRASLDKHIYIVGCLYKGLNLIKKNWQYVDGLPKEYLYMVFNIVKLAKSEELEEALELYNDEDFQKLQENYVKTR